MLANHSRRSANNLMLDRIRAPDLPEWELRPITGKPSDHSIITIVKTPSLNNDTTLILGGVGAREFQGVGSTSGIWQ